MSACGYTNDAIGRRTAMSRSGNVFTTPDALSYSYNDRSEITGASSDEDANYSYLYSFDNIGNRISASLGGTPYSYITNNLNQYSSFTKDQVAETPSYDDDGNMLSYDGWTLTWNAENRMIMAEKGNIKVEYSYDYLGRRFMRKEYSKSGSSWNLTSTEKYVYDGWNCIAQFNASGVLEKTWLWGEDMSGAFDGAGGVSGLLAETNSSGTYFPTYDGNGNICTYEDDEGNTVAAYEYSPFGQIISSTGAKADDFTYTFSTKPFDKATGLYYYIYRDYDPVLGRWITRDPLGDLSFTTRVRKKVMVNRELNNFDINLYSFIFNSPISNYDYLGLSIIDKIYGNWCGPNWTGGYKKPWNKLTAAEKKKVKPPIDANDAICKDHDIEYGRCETTHKKNKCDLEKCRRNADIVLADAYAELDGSRGERDDFGGEAPGNKQHVMSGIMRYIAGQAKDRDKWICENCP